MNRRDFLKNTLFVPLLPPLESENNPKHLPVVSFDKKGIPLELDELLKHPATQTVGNFPDIVLFLRVWINEFDALFCPREHIWIKKEGKLELEIIPTHHGNFFWGEMDLVHPVNFPRYWIDACWDTKETWNKKKKGWVRVKYSK